MQKVLSIPAVWDMKESLAVDSDSKTRGTWIFSEEAEQAYSKEDSKTVNDPFSAGEYLCNHLSRRITSSRDSGRIRVKLEA